MILGSLAGLIFGRFWSHFQPSFARFLQSCYNKQKCQKCTKTIGKTIFSDVLGIIKLMFFQLAFEGNFWGVLLEHFSEIYQYWADFGCS